METVFGDIVRTNKSFEVDNVEIDSVITFNQTFYHPLSVRVVDCSESKLSCPTNVRIKTERNSAT